VQLLHPNIVTAYGALQIGGLLVLKMEYVPGEDLDAVVKSRGPLAVVNACYYAQQTAVGLQYASGKEMVHRDIKPGNLMLAREGKKHVVKILDFGLVKAMAVERAEGDRLTGTGLGMGTPAYMAPEQAKDAARADIRSDIYSLGCTLYHLLAGRPPFSGLSQYDLWEAHRLMTATPLNEVRQDVPVPLAELVARMMAKDPARRYQKPVEVAQALAPFVKKVLQSLAAVPPPVGDAKPKPPQDGNTKVRKICAQETVLPPTAEPVPIPATLIEGQDTNDRAKKDRVADRGDHTAKPPPRKKVEEVRRTGPAPVPAESEERRVQSPDSAARMVRSPSFLFVLACGGVVGAAVVVLLIFLGWVVAKLAGH